MSEVDVEPRRRVSDVAAQKLLSLIRDGSYVVGSQLPSEQALAAQLGIGRSSMREAVRALQAQGILRASHGKGVFVTGSQPRRAGLDQSLMGGYTITDLFETRIAIEGATAELAAQRINVHHEEMLDTILDDAGNSNTSDEDFVALDRRFHRQIAEASGNPLMLHMWESLGDIFVEFSLKVISLPGRRERAHGDHYAIADAIATGDSKTARYLAEEHIRVVQRELKETQKRRPEPQISGESEGQEK